MDDIEHLLSIYDDLPRDQEDTLCQYQVKKQIMHIRDPAAVPLLIKASQHEDRGIRAVAIYALGEIGDPAAIPAFGKAIWDKTSAIGGLAIVGLAHIGGPTAVTIIVEALEEVVNQNKAPQWIYYALYALSRLGDSAALPVIFRVIETKFTSKFLQEQIRNSAIQALGRIGDPQVIPNLLGWINDPEFEELKGCIIEALGEIGDPQIIPHLLAWISDAEFEESKYHIIKTLGKIGDPQAIPILAQELKKEGQRWFDNRAATALAKIGTPEAIDHLMDALQYDHSRASAAYALGIAKARCALPALLETLNDHDEEVRKFTVGALGSIGDESAISPLIARLQIEDSEIVRWGIKSVLRSFDTPEARAALED